MGSSTYHGKCTLELKKARNLSASSRIFGGKTKIYAIMRFQALSHTTKTIIDMGNNAVWEQEIFTLHLNGCSGDTPVTIDIFKDGSWQHTLIGSIKLPILELCRVGDGIPQQKTVRSVTAKGKHHEEEVEILTTYYSVPNSYAPMYCPSPSRGYCPLPSRGYYQATAPVLGVTAEYVSPAMSNTSSVYQQPSMYQFQEKQQSKVHPSAGSKPPLYPPILSKPRRASKPVIPNVEGVTFYAYFDPIH